MSNKVGPIIFNNKRGLKQVLVHEVVFVYMWPFCCA